MSIDHATVMEALEAGAGVTTESNARMRSYFATPARVSDLKLKLIAMTQELPDDMTVGELRLALLDIELGHR